MHDYLQDMERLRSAGSLLLSGEDRQEVISFLDQLDENFGGESTWQH